MTWPGWEGYAPTTAAAKPKRIRAMSSKLEAALLQQIALCGLPAPEREVRLIEGRRYRWDMVWRAQRLAVEVQGATWTRGAHSRGKGQARDAEKQALATLAGYRCLSVTSDQVRSGQAVEWIGKALNAPRED